MERVRAGPDTVFNEMMAVNEDLQLPYTMDAHQLSNPYQAKVLRTDVNRAIPSYIPELLDESKLAFEDAFKVTDTVLGIADIEVFDTMTHLIARISNRVIFGKDLCRNQEFLRATVRFAETTPLMAPFIQWSPLFFRPFVYFLLSSILGGKRAPLKILVPFLNRYMKARQTMTEKPNLVSEFLIQNAPPQETVEGIAVRLLNINFGSIHTSSIFITQTLFEIALLRPEEVEGMRSEVEDALESEGGWNKAAVDRFYKIDSALREVGRYHGLMHFALPRYAIVGCELADGKFVPPGSRIAIDMKAIHFDADIYPDPNRCDLFRFSNMREKNGSGNSNHGFATVDSYYLPFGAGRHACAGRFFAAVELKIMLAHILLEYNISYPHKVNERPRNIIFNGAIIPDSKARLVFKRRKM
ncbi:Cytochrome P450 monooxygenase 151 [Psilocybe cubensis]|uniref:Cytochrome P450 monooxygenase 151 n=1 Tax=Psilocybe cubensis TaxID=181762 RepID=A0ACB8HE35_PSICU|nr:Cytochrome P450 monooxygenase 151 [Psilocybe cubensis]KAH9485405.1 Cytochrome P450 monooxygenase 151 [Psilocybe cubensis]